MDEKVKDSILLAAGIISVLLLLFLACGLVTVLFLVDENGDITVTIPDSPTAPTEPSSPVDEPVDTTNVSSDDLERWNRITLANVEDGCLKVAKDEAGGSASLVYDCECEETVDSSRKTYSCDIDTADPFTRYFANIDCFLEDTACSIETNYGLVTLTFQEMDEWYG